MLQQDEPKQAAEYLRQAIPMLSQHNLPPTPINYSIFYSYLSGNSQTLNDVIDSIISEKKPFTLAIMLELYEKYINGGATLEQQEKIQHSLEKVMSSASEEVQQVSSGAGEFDSANMLKLYPIQPTHRPLHLCSNKSCRIHERWLRTIRPPKQGCKKQMLKFLK